MTKRNVEKNIYFILLDPSMTAYKNDYGQIFDSQKSHRKIQCF